MARQAEGPWFRRSKNTWYVTAGGGAVSLGVRGEDRRAEAVTAWHRLMAGGVTALPVPAAPLWSVAKAPPTAAPGAKAAPPAGVTVRGMVDAFLEARRGTVKAASLYAYAHHLSRVAAAFPRGVPTADAFGKWLAGLTLSASSKNTVAGAAATLFKWAVSAGLAGTNPLDGVRKPPKASRGAGAVVAADAHARLMAAAPEAVRVVLTLLSETGARPGEVARLTAKDVDLVNAVAVLVEHKTAHAGRPRVIFLSPAACDVLRGLMAARPEGALALNEKGRPWTKDALGHALRRVCRKAGVKAVAYGYRHTFATSALSRGVPDAHVAALLGHTSTAMVHKHYSHLGSQAAVLRDALNQVK